MPTTAERIVEALDALILAKVEGAEDLSSFYNRQLGALGIQPATSLKELTALREKWDEIAGRDDSGGGEARMTMI